MCADCRGYVCGHASNLQKIEFKCNMTSHGTTYTVSAGFPRGDARPSACWDPLHFFFATHPRNGRTHTFGKNEALGSDERDLAAAIRLQTHVVVLQQGQYSWPNDMRFNLHGPQTPQLLRCIKKPHCYAT